MAQHRNIRSDVKTNRKREKGEDEDDDNTDRFFHWIVKKSNKTERKESKLTGSKMNYLIMTSVEFY